MLSCNCLVPAFIVSFPTVLSETVEISFTVLSYTSKIPTGFQNTLSNLYIQDQLEIATQKTITTFSVSSVNMCISLFGRMAH
jgi:hypothetical protein